MNTFRAMQAQGAGHDFWLPTLRLAAKEVFDLMLASGLEDAPESLPDKKLEVTSMVGLAGGLSGILSIRCSTKSAVRMASRMLGADSDKPGPEVWDAVGEVCNMVAGNFKNKITGLGDGCTLSVPTVITGADYERRTMAVDEISVTLMFEAEPLVLSLEVQS